jgi:uncharacterized membrane protein YfcA
VAAVFGLETEIVAALFGVAVLAACIDAIAGGGGLLTVPALLLAGLDPAAALATNKLQGSAGSVSATVHFARRGLVDWRLGRRLMVASGGAAVLGALSVSLLSQSVLDVAVPLILITIAVYFALARRMSDDDRHARLATGLFLVSVVPVIGFYDGFFGPGTGSFFMVGFVSLLGYGVIRATAHTKLANASSNVGALALFSLTGHMNWGLGLTMALGAFMGAQIGSRLAIRAGARLIRPLLVVVCCAMALRLLLQPSNPLHQWMAELWF